MRYIAGADGREQATGQEIELLIPPIPSLPTEPHPDPNVCGGPHLQAPEP